MIGPVDTSQDEPLDPAGFRHQMLLLKSLHCGRPVLYDGRHQFIQCLTTNRSGCDIEMLVYLAGKPGAIDSSQVQIKTTNQHAAEETHSA